MKSVAYALNIIYGMDAYKRTCNEVDSVRERSIRFGQSMQSTKQVGSYELLANRLADISVKSRVKDVGKRDQYLKELRCKIPSCAYKIDGEHVPRDIGDMDVIHPVLDMDEIIDRMVLEEKNVLIYICCICARVTEKDSISEFTWSQNLIPQSFIDNNPPPLPGISENLIEIADKVSPTLSTIVENFMNEREKSEQPINFEELMKLLTENKKEIYDNGKQIAAEIQEMSSTGDLEEVKALVNSVITVISQHTGQDIHNIQNVTTHLLDGGGDLNELRELFLSYVGEDLTNKVVDYVGDVRTIISSSKRCQMVALSVLLDDEALAADEQLFDETLSKIKVALEE